MSIPSLIIKRISGGDYRIDDLGIVVPNADQTEITGLHAIRDALCSAKLHAAAEAADLVLNDGSRDIPVAEISCFVRRFDTGHIDDVASYANLPGTGVERQIYLVADTKTTYMWNGSGWSQVNVGQKRCNGAIVSKFDDSLPTAYAHPTGNGVTTYERFQDGADNASGAGYAGASREWVAGAGGDGGGGDYDGGAGGDLLVRPGPGGTKAGTGTDGAVGNFVVWNGTTKFFKVSREGHLVADAYTAETDGDLWTVKATPASASAATILKLWAAGANWGAGASVLKIISANASCKPLVINNGATDVAYFSQGGNLDIGAQLRGVGNLTVTTQSNGDITLLPNGTGIVIVDAAELKVKSGKKLALGDGGAATDCGMWFNGSDAHTDLKTGVYKNLHGGVVKWTWTSTELYVLNNVYFALGTGGYAADWYAKYDDTNCEMKIVSGEWQFWGGASEIYVINSSGQHGWFGASPVAQHSSTGQTAGFTAGSGTGVNDDSTFTGGVGSTAYTVGDLVKALKNYGLMAA